MIWRNGNCGAFNGPGRLFCGGVCRKQATRGVFSPSRSALPILCDVFDQALPVAAAKDFRPDVIVHQLTDLRDEIERIAELALANNRVRDEGTRNLLAAAQSAGAQAFVASPGAEAA